MVATENTISDWVRIIRSEYCEIPGLILTKQQCQRLWGLDRAACDTVLGLLMRTKFLRRTENDTYARADISH
jgi:hypothetical protein